MIISHFLRSKLQWFKPIDDSVPLEFSIFLGRINLLLDLGASRLMYLVFSFTFLLLKFQECSIDLIFPITNLFSGYDVLWKYPCLSL